MAERGGKILGMGIKPVPMRLFATWEVEKSSPNCIPRLCTLTLTRLIITKPLENELNSVLIAVKMQNSKRILRSNEIIMPNAGLLDTEIDLSFSLQYPHFLKRDGNKLQVMLQRRKKYKNRTILGYKTLAMGQVNMSQVLQRSIDRELSLYSDPKECTHKVAQVIMPFLSSQPVDHEDNGRVKLRAGEVDRSPDIDLSDDEDDDANYWSNEEMSDSDHDHEEVNGGQRSNRLKSQRGPVRQARQRNFKEKFIAMLKKFKVNEEGLETEADQEGNDVTQEQDIETLLDELEDLSDSGPEMDNISVLSTPKPKLRPFFTGKGNAQDILDLPKDSGKQSDDSSKRYDSDSYMDSNTDPESESNYPAEASASHESRGACPADASASHESRGTFSSSSEITIIEQAKECEESSIPSSHPASPHSSAPNTPPVNHGTSHPLSAASSSPMQQRQRAINRAISVKEPGKPLPNLEVQDRVKDGRSSLSQVETSPRKVLLDQLGQFLSLDESLPDCLLLVNTNEWQGQLLAQVLKDSKLKVIQTCSAADIKACINFIVNKIQKFCNSNSRAPAALRLALAGNDSYLHAMLRPYVEQFSAKSPDWQHYIKFLFIPLGPSTIGKYFGSLDSTYNSLFLDVTWIGVFDKPDNQKPDVAEIVNRISCFVSGASNVVQMPIAEAMITCKERSHDAESCQIFVPFISEVRIGSTETCVCTSSVDIEEGYYSMPSNAVSSSPPASTPTEKVKDNHTPPSSPNINQPHMVSSQSNSGMLYSSGPEIWDLNLDYWFLEGRAEVGPRDRLVKKDSKSSLKTTFKCVQVFRIPQQACGSSEVANTVNLPMSPGTASMLPNSSFSMVVVTKEKKQKMIRLGKKPKADEQRSQYYDGISRLICTSKSSNHTLTVSIDGTEWNGIKFFQLSAQWQTHIKQMPLLLFSLPEQTNY